MKKIKDIHTINKILMVTLTLVSCYFAYTILKLNVLPNKYLIPFLVVGVVIYGLVMLYLIKSRKAYAKIIAILSTIAIILVAPKIAELEGTLDDITDLSEETYTIHVITHIDSAHKTMDDVKDLVFGANTTQDEVNILRAQALIKEAGYDIHYKRYESYDDMITDFYTFNPEVYLISEADIEFLIDNQETFEDHYKIIASYSYTVDLEENKDTNVSTDTFNIYISGIDTGGDISSVSRSDANIILTVNPLKNQILMTSIPRDTFVIRHTNGQYDKLSLVGRSGITETVKTIEDLMEMDIHYTLRVNWTSVIKVVDALGGIEVNNPYAFKQGQYYFNKGVVQLDGERALAFVRNRKSLPDDEDSRAQNQQRVLTAIIQKMMSPSIIYNYSDFLNAISGSVQTTMPQNQLNKLIKNQINDMPTWEIFTTQLVGDMFDTWDAFSHMGKWQIVKEPHKDKLIKAQKLIESMKNNETITQEMLEN